MFASEPVLVDPEPQGSPGDLAWLDWDTSWDRTSTGPVEDGHSAPADPDIHLDGDLDVELAALLDSVRRDEPDGGSAQDVPLVLWSDAAIVAEAARVERVSRWASARGYQLVEELARRRPEPSGDPQERGLSGYAIDEVAVGVGISRWAACRRVAEADALTHRHPLLLAALSAGCVGLPVVQRVLEATAVLDPAGCATVERRLLTRLGRPVLADLGTASAADLAGLSTEQVMGISAKASPGYAGRVARQLAQQVDPAAARRRERKAKTGRSVRLELAGDGMAWLTAHLPAAAALAAYEHVDALAHTLPTHVAGGTDGEPDLRSMDAKRADVLTGLLLGAGITPEGAVTPPAPVHLHVILDTRPGHSETDLPGEVARLGPVTADTLRDLLDLTEHTAGTVHGALALDQPCPGRDVHDRLGPGPYTPPERLKNLLRVRHRTCVFPGCTRASRLCELDHTQPYPTGPTCSCNLAPLCVHHHHLKHHAPGWTLTNHGNGHLTWTTPTGQHLHTGHHDTDDSEGPAPPPDDPDPPPDHTPRF